MITTIIVALGIFFCAFGLGCGLIAFIVPGKSLARDKAQEDYFEKQRRLALKGCASSFALGFILFFLAVFLDYIMRYTHT